MYILTLNVLSHAWFLETLKNSSSTFLLIAFTLNSLNSLHVQTQCKTVKPNKTKTKTEAGNTIIEETLTLEIAKSQKIPNTNINTCLLSSINKRVPEHVNKLF